MPYISTKAKTELLERGPLTAGELNYLISKLCNTYLLENVRNYDTHNTIVGVLECAKQEYYRRMTVPYECSKMLQNGDVYDHE